MFMNQDAESRSEPHPGGDPFTERRYFKTDVRKGVIRTAGGARICCLTTDFLLGLRKGLTHECGAAADEILKNAGFRTGRQFAKRFQSDLRDFFGSPFEELTMAEVEGCLVSAFSRHGWENWTWTSRPTIKG